MKKSRFRLITGIAASLVVASTVCSRFFSTSTRDSGNVHMHSSGLSREITNLNRPRPEIQLERLLNLPDLNNRDLDIASVLDPNRMPRQKTSSQNSASYQEVASLPLRKGGDGQ